MDQWFVKNAEGDVFGPAALDDLKAWAADGRITPDAYCSTDQASWYPAPEVTELGMNLVILVDEEQTYGPLHVLAMRDLILDGSLDPGLPVRHVKSEEVRAAGDWLVRALTDEQARVASELESLQREVKSLKSRPPVARIPRPEPEPKPTGTVIGSGAAEREAGKWKQLYETEKAHRLESEKALKDANRELLDQLHEVQAAKNRLAYKVNQLEHPMPGEDGEHLSAPDADRATHDTALQEAYQQLSNNYDKLLAQLREKSAEIDELRGSSNEDREKQHQDQLRHLEQQRATDRQDAERLRRQLNELESTHRELVRSYRDMNDKYIRLRQNVQPAPAES